eukprot:scaffold6475_cov115-Pinguiococcus_pyrenoidosus.AAC.1
MWSQIQQRRREAFPSRVFESTMSARPHQSPVFGRLTGGRIRARPPTRTNPDFGRDLSRQGPNTNRARKT